MLRFKACLEVAGARIGCVRVQVIVVAHLLAGVLHGGGHAAGARLRQRVVRVEGGGLRMDTNAGCFQYLGLPRQGAALKWGWLLYFTQPGTNNGKARGVHNFARLASA